MNQSGLMKLYWGFLFIMINFRLQGIDILPDIVGYLFFAAGFGILMSCSEHFNKARNLNIAMIILSIFEIYQKPARGGGIQFGTFGVFGVLISIASIILNLLIVYNLFMGIKDMASQSEKMDLYEEADKRWSQYLALQIGVIFAFIFVLIPPLALIIIIVLLIAAIVLTIAIMGFIKRCSESL
jgi:hypothetical protein